VANGWDPDVLGGRGGPAGPSARSTRPLRFSYVGTVTTVQRCVEWFTRPAARTHRRSPTAELNLYGHPRILQGGHVRLTQQNCWRWTAKPVGGEDTGIHYRGRSPDRVAHTYAESRRAGLPGRRRPLRDVRQDLRVHGNRAARSCPCTPGHRGGRGAGRGYPLWFNADSLEPDDIAQAMDRGRQGGRRPDPETRAAASGSRPSSYTRDRVPGSLRSQTTFFGTPQSGVHTP